MKTESTLRPSKEKLVLAKVPRDLFLNPISLEDDEWLEENIGAEKFTEAFAKVNMEPILKFIWKIMDDDSKEYVVNIKLLKWEGEKKVPADFDEPWKKLKSLTCGGNEILQMFNAIASLRAKSNPEVKATEKKKQQEESHSPSSNAMTSSPASTDTPQPSSTP